jgi:DNA-binding LacI/PurR family transcriptional regulator
MSPGSKVSYVAADDRDGARDMVRHLLSLGRRRIGVVTGPLDSPGGVDRLAGYKEVLAEAGIEIDERLVTSGDYSRASGESGAERLLAQAPDMDAVFVASDLMACGALRALRELGRRIPDDVAVVGFEDAPIAQSAHPPLTTVHQSPERMGREMVALLLDEMAEPEREHPGRMLSTHLVVRDSS